MSAERYHWCLGENGEVDNYHINYKKMLEDYDRALCPQKGIKSSSSKLHATYGRSKSWNNGKRECKYGSLTVISETKREKDRLNEELRRLFDYEQSYSEEASLMSDGNISVRVKDNSFKSLTRSKATDTDD